MVLAVVRYHSWALGYASPSDCGTSQNNAIGTCYKEADFGDYVGFCWIAFGVE